jgi:hypothetical protein
LFQDADGTGAATNGDPVGYVQDKSGAGNHATQSGSTSFKPTLVTASTNGKASLSFDNGSLQSLGFSSNPLAGSSAGTAFYVCRGNLGGGSCIGHPLGKFGMTGDADHYPCGSAQYSSFGRDTRFSFSYDPPFTSTHVGVVMSRSADWRFWFKDTLATTQTGSNVSWGSYAGIGGNRNESNAAFYYPGVVCEVLLYAAAVSDADRATITNYLVSKWGIA